MSSQIITDLSVGKPWVARTGFNNPFTITFTNAAAAFNTTAYTFVLNIRKIGYDSNILQLTQSSGITNGGATGIVSVQLTAANTELLRSTSYYYEINYTIGGLDYGLLHGTLSLVNQYNPDQANNSITVPVNLAGTDLNMAITLAGGSALTVSTQTTTTTLTPNGSFDAYEITAQSGPLTIANPSTDYANFDGFQARVTGSGTLALGSKYVAMGEAFITTITAGKTIIITAQYKSDTDEYNTRITEEV
jgi:hypothetical protein